MISSYVVTKAETVMPESVMRVTFDDGDVINTTVRGNEELQLGFHFERYNIQNLEQRIFQQHFGINLTQTNKGKDL